MSDTELSKQKVAIYIRVSTAMQIDKDSLQVQRRELVAYSTMVLSIDDYEIFEDPGFSAKNTERPAYQQMMNRLRTGEFSHLLVWKIDRISRNLLDFSEMYNELKKLGVTFISKNEQFDTGTAMGEAMLKIILVFAELERKMTSERVTAVMLSRANNGQWNGGRIPYGYSYDKQKHEFSINEEEAKMVLHIYDLYEEYQSLCYISRNLNERGLKTRHGNQWSAVSVHKILSSKFYMGTYVYNVHAEGTGYKRKDETEWINIENHHPAIIDAARFDRMQFMLKRNRRYENKPGDTYVKKREHIFAGLCRCGVCGANMSAHIDRRRSSGWCPSKYYCSNRRENTAKCMNKYVSDVTLGPFVFNFVANILRASNATADRLTIKSLQAKLLSSVEFENVGHIESSGLSDLLSLLKTGKTGLEYAPLSLEEEKDISDECSALAERKRKNEIALNRLHSLYLFDGSGMSEKDYILERQELMDDISKINSRLKEITGEDPNGIVKTDDTVEKASYFMMVEQLLSNRHVDFEKYIRTVDPHIPKSFLRRVIEYIEVTDGRVTAIQFKNKILIRFVYKQQ